VAHEHTSVHSKEVRDQLARHLPSYMVPSQITQLTALPLTRNGKVNRAALRAMPVDETAVPPGATPTTETERRLSDIWCKLLGVTRLGVDDDFFDRGGHSLLAVGLVSAIEREFGQPLGVATLIEARTIRQLAQVVERQKPVASWGALVVLQPRGHEPPFYCVHGVGGEVLGYAPLAIRMGNDRPFVGIQANDEIRSADPVHGIAAQAAAYVREIRRFQPNGPYHLGGYSHGGRVALEMALRLEAEGQRVAFLGVLDTTPVGVHYNSLGYWLRVARNAPRWLWYDALRTPWRENAERVRRALRRRGGLLTPRVPADARLADVRDTMDISNLPPAYLARYRWDYLAFCSYVPAGRCQSGITVFKAKGQPLLASHDPDLGWSAVTRGSVEVVEVAGNHTSILTEPNVTGLADALRTALEASAART
jgi:thioesterase domain-containing protein/acyl carrier protein